MRAAQDRGLRQFKIGSALLMIRWCHFLCARLISAPYIYI